MITSKSDYDDHPFWDSSLGSTLKLLYISSYLKGTSPKFLLITKLSGDNHTMYVSSSTTSSQGKIRYQFPVGCSRSSTKYQCIKAILVWIKTYPNTLVQYTPFVDPIECLSKEEYDPRIPSCNAIDLSSESDVIEFGISPRSSRVKEHHHLTTRNLTGNSGV